MSKSSSSPTSPKAARCRLNKFLAQAGVCSRRKADGYISAGRVRINGHVVTELGTRILPDQDKIEVDGKPLSSPETAAPEGQHTYILVHKPVQVVTTANDPQGRKTVLDLLPASAQPRRVFPVGRLDFMSEGVLLLTSDGELTNRFTHPSWEVEKVYSLTVRGAVAEWQIQQMRAGMSLKEGERLAPVGVKQTACAAETTELELTLHQGLNRQIRRMCRDLGLTILRLKRTQQGPLALGNLAPGQWRPLNASEITALRKTVGLEAR
ncbi:MAG: pseudouridine synthase [Thermodesulfobacteriota bacterium]